MLGFTTAIYAESALKSGIFVEVIRFLVCIYRSTQPTDLFSSSRYSRFHKGISHFGLQKILRLYNFAKKLYNLKNVTW